MRRRTGRIRPHQSHATDFPKKTGFSALVLSGENGLAVLPETDERSILPIPDYTGPSLLHYNEPKKELKIPLLYRTEQTIRRSIGSMIILTLLLILQIQFVSAYTFSINSTGASFPASLYEEATFSYQFVSDNVISYLGAGSTTGI